MFINDKQSFLIHDIGYIQLFSNTRVTLITTHVAVWKHKYVFFNVKQAKYVIRSFNVT